MEMLPVLHLTASTYYSLSVLQGLVLQLKIFTYATEQSQKNYWNNDKGITNFAKPSPNSIIEIYLSSVNTNVIWKLSCDKVFLIRNFMVTRFTNFVRFLDIVYFENLFYKRIKSFLKKDYDPVILQRTSRLVIDPSTVDSHAFLFGCAMTDRV